MVETTVLTWMATSITWKRVNCIVSSIVQVSLKLSNSPNSRRLKRRVFLALILELKKVDDETAVGRVKGDADWLRRRHKRSSPSDN